MTTVTPSRRERLRTATVAEIKQTARQLLVTGGPPAISLRAIAREMGMTAPAIYRYFPSLEKLVSELCADLYEELSAAIEADRTAIPAGRPAERLRAMAHAFRRWSTTHRAEFSLMFGEPIAGAPHLDDGCERIPAGVMSFCEGFMVEFAELWQQHQIATPPLGMISERLVDQLAPELLALRRDLPIEVIYLFLSGWIRLYGMVAMEVFGHLSWALTDTDALFETEMAAYIHQLTG
jgi:AcrR family transcriptional regulator